MFRQSTNKPGAMTTREVIDLLNLKRGHDATMDSPITYRGLRKALMECAIQLKSRKVAGEILTSYIARDDIHQLAYYFGVDLYPRRRRR